MAAEWQGIGILLGVDPDTLEIIKQDEEKCHSCLREMLRKWLKQQTPTPTWHSLVKVVEMYDQTKAGAILKHFPQKKPS